MSHWTDDGKLIREVGETFVVYDVIYLIVVVSTNGQCDECYWNDCNRDIIPHCSGDYRRETAGECVFRKGYGDVNFKRVGLDRNKEK